MGVYKDVKSRFDLEEQLMDCWDILNDIKTFREHFELSDKEDNYLLGLDTIYAIKFENMFETFSELVHNSKL